MSGLADQILKIAIEAGRRIIAVAASGLAIETKADASPVTSADMAAHKYIMSSLQALTPDVPVISEESGTDEAAIMAEIRRTEKYWLVDPLDGTKDFLAGTGDFTVNIALIDRGEPVLGTIVAPAKGRQFLAEKGRGAIELLEEGGMRRLMTRKTLRSSPTVLLSRHHPGGEAARITKAFPEARMTAVGSSLKYSVIAAGEADMTLRRTPTKLWDLGAGQAILSVAGGVILTFDGEPLDYSGKVMTHPPFIALGDPTFWPFLEPLIQAFVATASR